MPNSTFVSGSPVLNAVKGFDRPDELYVYRGEDGFTFIGYYEQVMNLRRNCTYHLTKFNPIDFQ